MRTTVTIDDELLVKAAELTGVTENAMLLRQGLQIRVESGRRLAVWIGHLHAAEAQLVDLLRNDQAGRHDFVIEELALGSIKQQAACSACWPTSTGFPR